MDRNPYIPLAKVRHCESLSARRAWIEMNVGFPIAAFLLVALRKESVDRNTKSTSAQTAPSWSLSARRAWIEIGG